MEVSPGQSVALLTPRATCPTQHYKCGGGLNQPNGLLKKVWGGLPARVFTGWKPVPHEKEVLLQQPSKVSTVISSFE